jgi:hypothetical protein
MEKEKLSTEEIVEYYRADVGRLTRYLSYFEGKKASDVSSRYSGEGMGKNAIHFPIYDSMLLAFVKEVQDTVFIDPNYRYVYTRNQIHTHQDELHKIKGATLLDMELLAGIMSKYVLGGMTKGALWTEAVEYGIFYNIIDKARELIAFWDRSK